MSNQKKNPRCAATSPNVSVEIVSMSHEANPVIASCSHSSTTVVPINILPGSRTSTALKRPASSSATGSTSADSEECSFSIVYGNKAQYIAENNRLPELPEGHTHLWTVYVRPYKQSESAALAQLITRVVFVLEPHYRNVSVEAPPFQVTRTGWGEFAVKIRIHFQDVLNAKPLVLSHDLRLVVYHSPERSGHQVRDDWSYVPFVREEKYDEIVVYKPTAQQRAVFASLARNSTNSTKSSASQSALDQHERARVNALEAIVRAKQVIERRLADVKACLIANQMCTAKSLALSPELVSCREGAICKKKRSGRPKKTSERNTQIGGDRAEIVDEDTLDSSTKYSDGESQASFGAGQAIMNETAASDTSTISVTLESPVEEQKNPEKTTKEAN